MSDSASLFGLLRTTHHPQWGPPDGLFAFGLFGLRTAAPSPVGTPDAAACRDRRQLRRPPASQGCFARPRWREYGLAEKPLIASFQQGALSRFCGCPRIAGARWASSNCAVRPLRACRRPLEAGGRRSTFPALRCGNRRRSRARRSLAIAAVLGRPGVPCGHAGTPSGLCAAIFAVAGAPPAIRFAACRGPLALPVARPIAGTGVANFWHE